MTPGQMRERITLQSPTRTRDAHGDEVPAWLTQFADVPAAWLPGPGREILAGESVRAETVGRLVLRWLPGVAADWRVLWNGQAFALTAPPLDRGNRTDLTLLVAAGVADDGA
jgi:head-tail adaptor